MAGVIARSLLPAGSLGGRVDGIDAGARVASQLACSPWWSALSVRGSLWLVWLAPLLAWRPRTFAALGEQGRLALLERLSASSSYVCASGSCCSSSRCASRSSARRRCWRTWGHTTSHLVAARAAVCPARLELDPASVCAMGSAAGVHDRRLPRRQRREPARSRGRLRGRRQRAGRRGGGPRARVHRAQRGGARGGATRRHARSRAAGLRIDAAPLPSRGPDGCAGRGRHPLPPGSLRRRHQLRELGHRVAPARTRARPLAQPIRPRRRAPRR